MSPSVIEHAHQLIRSLHERLIAFRKETYKTVHDDIGSTLSAVSIKAKILSEKLTDGYEKQQLIEIHGLIRETLEHVTTLNRKLKVSWVPQGTPTLFADIKKELQTIQNQYGITIDFDVKNEKALQKLSFATLTLIYEWVTVYVHNSIERLAQSLNITVEVFEDRLEWKFAENSSIQPSETQFQSLIEKTNTARGTFTITHTNENVALLTLPMKGDT